MIKLLLKHLIMEICLSKLFENISMNFPSISFDTTDLILYNYINVSVLVYGNSIKLIGCQVTKLEESTVHLEYSGFDNKITLIVQNGQLIDIKGDYSTIVNNFLRDGSGKAHDL